MSAPAVFSDLADLLRAAPMDLGASEWVELEAADVERFWQATGSPEVGYLLLSLTNRLLPELIQVPGAASGVNYGAESVRFGEAVPAGARVRARAELVESVEVRGGVQTTIEITVEAEGGGQGGSGGEPPCVVRSLSRWLS